MYTLNELLNSDNGEIVELLDNLDSYELDVVEAILELNYWKYDTEKKADLYDIEDLENAIEDLNHKTHFRDWGSYYDYCDELLYFPKDNDILERYFDYDAYHKDCGYDVSEASNWIILADR